MPDPITATLPSPPAATSPGTASPPARFAAAAITLALMPFPLVLHGWGDPKLSYDYLTILFPVDLALAGLIVVGIVPLAQRIRGRRAGAGVLLWTVLAAVMSAAWVVHPSGRGLHTVFELWGVAVLAGTIAEMVATDFSALLIGAFAVVAVGESVWATTQLLIGGGLGLTGLGEDAHPLWPFSRTASAPMGSMVHPYVLAGLALVAAGVLTWHGVTARRPAPSLLAAALAVAPVGFTYSRAGLLSVLLLIGSVIAAAVGRPDLRRRCGAAALLLVLGTAIPALIWSDGWRTRAAQTTSASTAATFTTDRGRLTHEALEQFGSHPIAGVGPGRYVIALQQRYGVEKDRSVGIFKPVHNVPLLVGSEGGVLAMLTVVALYLILGWRALRAGPLVLGSYLAYLPFSMLDHFAYTFPQGLVITAVWIGALDHASRPSSRALPTDVDTLSPA